MKKRILLLIAVCALTAVSCMRESTFIVNNYVDFAVSSGGKLFTDTGYQLTVSNNASGSSAYQEDNKRFYLICDILNRDLDILLKTLEPVTIKDALPYEPDEEEPDDPVSVSHSFGGGYMNLLVDYSYRPGSQYEHKINLFQETRNGELCLYLLHDGNHENTAYMSESELKRETRYFSFPIRDILSSRDYAAVSLTLYELKDNTVNRKTYYLQGY